MIIIKKKRQNKLLCVPKASQSPQFRNIPQTIIRIPMSFNVCSLIQDFCKLWVYGLDRLQGFRQSGQATSIAWRTDNQKEFASFVPSTTKIMFFGGFPIFYIGPYNRNLQNSWFWLSMRCQDHLLKTHT